jgi:hypothetical protein
MNSTNPVLTLGLRPLRRSALSEYHAADIGALAQLGERLHGMQEVRGSSPLGSKSPQASLRKRVPKPESAHLLARNGSHATTKSAHPAPGSVRRTLELPGSLASF